MKKNFNNQNFEWLFDDITSTMPKIIFVGIILTYAITAALNVYFLPLPLLLSIPASLMLQFGRFAIVYVWYWGWDMQKWAFVYLGHTKVDICVCEVLGLGYA